MIPLRLGRLCNWIQFLLCDATIATLRPDNWQCEVQVRGRARVVLEGGQRTRCVLCNLFVLGFDLLYNKVPCQMQMS